MNKSFQEAQKILKDKLVEELVKKVKTEEELLDLLFAKKGSLTSGEIREIERRVKDHPEYKKKIKKGVTAQQQKEEEKLEVKKGDFRRLIITGKPLAVTVYRGISGTPADPGDLGRGTYYTSDPSYAKQYGRLTSDKIKLRNPLVLKGNDALKLISEYKTVEEQVLKKREKNSARLTFELLKKGYDGIVAFDYETNAEHFVVVVFPKTVNEQDTLGD